MIIVEVFVWIVAAFISSAVLFVAPEHFQTTLITKVFYQILCHPVPYWAVIFLCCIGTFTSIYFGDEMLDVIGHKQRKKHHQHGFKYKVIALISVTLLVTVVYYRLMTEFGISIH